MYVHNASAGTHRNKKIFSNNVQKLLSHTTTNGGKGYSTELARIVKAKVKCLVQYRKAMVCRNISHSPNIATVCYHRSQ